jgi:predicted CXXCH cytochrome family protein
MRPQAEPSSTAPRWVWTTAIVGLSLAVWVGCSPEKHYQTLSFFFDGVPDPNAKKNLAGNTSKSDPKSTGLPVISHHKPFTDKDCASCHTGGADNITSALNNTTCTSCHDKTLTQHAMMHPAVNVNTCLWCHAPHESVRPHLLRDAATELCAQCHEQSRLSTKVVEHTKAGIDCLSCHMGHGGPDRFMLRKPDQAGAASPFPTTKPAQASASRP